jgi:hypothetical protein
MKGSPQVVADNMRLMRTISAEDENNRILLRAGFATEERNVP